MSELPHGEVTIADVFRALLSIDGTVQSMNTRLEVLAAQAAAAERATGDHENRLRSLEAAKAKLVGAASAGGVIAGALGGYISAHLH